MADPAENPGTPEPSMPVGIAMRRWLAHAQHAYGEHLPLAVPEPLPLAQLAPETPQETPPAAPAEDPPEAPPGPTPEAPPEPAAQAPTGRPARSLEEIAAEVHACTACKLCTQRTRAVPGEGSPTAEVMFVGEAPGAREDTTGRPFVGPAGELLDRIIHNAMGMERAETFIANVNKCRPPNNRNPEPDEVAACLPFLREQIRAIRPRVLVTLGRVAAANLLGRDEPLARLRGRPLEFEGIPVVATWHPAYLLRNPAAKRDTWEDIKRVNRLLGRPEDPRQG